MYRAVFSGLPAVAFSLRHETFLIDLPVAADSGASVATQRFHGLEISFFVSHASSRPVSAIACRVPSLSSGRTCSVSYHLARGNALP